MNLLNQIIAYGLAGVALLIVLNVVARLFWPRRTRPTPVPDDEVHGGVPHVGER